MSAEAVNLQAAATCIQQFFQHSHFSFSLSFKIIFTHGPENCIHNLQAIPNYMQYLLPHQNFHSESITAQILFWCTDKAGFHPTDVKYLHGQTTLQTKHTVTNWASFSSNLFL